ncbi:hypothetical protein SSS_06030 [Sarcoptes scabiei]|nr:hypothetical protein SSS_06030 [Sarcoptes scabiei]
MMNFSSYTDQLKIYRMKDLSSELKKEISSDRLEHIHWPFLLHFERDNEDFEIISAKTASEQSDELYFDTLIRTKFIKTQPSDQFETQHFQTIKKEDASDSNNLVQYSKRVYISDLHNAIRFALFQEIALKKYLNIEQTNSLIRLLNVLHESFHFQNFRTKQFIKRLHDWLTDQVQLRSKNDGLIETSDILTTMNMYEEYYHFPEHKKWQACADVSSERQRSYPCSLWTLFHFLTVAEYRRSLKTKQWLGLHPALYAMREYIKHFFACTECSKHFVSMASTLENELIFPNSSVLWLWNAHNRVNARLKKSGSEDYKLPKRQFPTYEECESCYRHKPDVKFYNDYETYHSYFDEKKVLDFLVKFYSVENLVLDAAEIDIEQKQHQTDSDSHLPTDFENQNVLKNDASKPHSKILMLVSSPFSKTDISLIFVFYLVSIILLIFICGFLRLRRKVFHKVFNLKQRIY